MISRRPKQKRRLYLTLAASILTVSFALSGCSSTDSGGTKIRIADTYSTKHPFARYGVSKFIESSEAGGIIIDYFPAGQMGNPQDLANMVRTKVIDIGPASAAYLEDEFPLSSVSDLPQMTDDACVAAKSMMELLSPGGILYESEYKPRGMRPLWIAIIPGYEAMTRDKKVERPTDLKGLLIRSSGGAFDVTNTELGASPVSMSAGETYEALARGTVDGTAFPYVSAVSYSVHTVIKYTTVGLNLGSVGIPYVISEKSWNRLSGSQQKTLAEAADVANESLCQGLNTEANDALSKIADAGVELTYIEGADAQAWNDSLTRVKSRWAESLDETGKPGTEVLKAYEEAVRRNEQ